MKTGITAAFAAFILLISFQNCQPPPHADEINSSTLSSSGSTASKIDLNTEVIDSVQFVVADSKVMSKAGRSYEVKYNKILEIDLQTGGISESSDVDSTVNTYCLPVAMKSELVAILKASQVCRGQSKNDGRVCSQALKLPYASLITGRDNFDLGSATDGCGSNAVDLCDNQSDSLKGFIAALKSKYQSMSCN